jgi:hypothetical protein
MLLGLDNYYNVDMGRLRKRDFGRNLLGKVGLES